MVLVGAEGVVENGGVINKLGTYQAAVSAHCHNTPFYVAAESYKVFTPLINLETASIHSPSMRSRTPAVLLVHSPCNALSNATPYICSRGSAVV